MNNAKKDIIEHHENHIAYVCSHLLDDTHMMSMRIVQFLGPLTTLLNLHPKFSHPLTLDIQFQTNLHPYYKW